MKKYSVTLYYHTNIVVEVSAENEKEAIENARQMAARDDQETIDILLGGMYEDDQPDCDIINEEVDERMRRLHNDFTIINGHYPKFAYVVAKYNENDEQFNAYVKLTDYIPCHTDGDPDDDYVHFYAEGIDGLCSINTEHNADFSIVDIIEFCDTCGNVNGGEEDIRHALSRLLMETNEQHPMDCDITLQSGAVGLSELEKPTVKKLFQDNEGIIWVCIEGHEEPIELDDIPMEWQHEIVNYFYV